MHDAFLGMFPVRLLSISISWCCFPCAWSPELQSAPLRGWKASALVFFIFRRTSLEEMLFLALMCSDVLRRANIYTTNSIGSKQQARPSWGSPSGLFPPVAEGYPVCVAPSTLVHSSLSTRFRLSSEDVELQRPKVQIMQETFYSISRCSQTE